MPLSITSIRQHKDSSQSSSLKSPQFLLTTNAFAYFRPGCKSIQSYTYPVDSVLSNAFHKTDFKLKQTVNAFSFAEANVPDDV